MIEIDFDSLRVIGLTPYTAQQLLQLDETPADAFSACVIPARVIEVQREWMLLHNGEGEY